MTQRITAAAMQLGDVVQVGEGPWVTAIVVKITTDYVTFSRPYGRVSETAYGEVHSASAIFYTGTETYSVPKSSSHTYLVWERGKVRVS